MDIIICRWDSPNHSLVAWMDANDNTIHEAFGNYLRSGETCEVLEYMPNLDPSQNVTVSDRVCHWRAQYEKGNL